AGAPAAMLAALKPRGNPLASGRAGDWPRPGDGVTVRLRDGGGPGGGRPVPARVTLFTGIQAAAGATLREEPGPPLPVEQGVAVAEVPPSGLATVTLTPGSADHRGVAAPGAGDRSGEAVPPEPVQPVFTRYWLHGKGPAPAGNLPVAVHLSPGRLALAAPGGNGAPGLRAAATMRLTVAGGPQPATGTAELVVPPGLTVAGGDNNAEPPRLRYELAPDGYASWDLTVAAAPGAAPGHYFVAARISDDLGQALEDAVLVTVGEPPVPPEGLPLPELLPLIEADQQAVAAEVGISLLASQITLRPGERGEIGLRLACRAGSPVRGESQLISPFGSWELSGSPAAGFTARPGEEIVLRHLLAAAPDARPGNWWALAKVMYFGRVRYTDSVAVTISS
ncbi:MAG: hypothetical protein J2P35_21095, partial [Actinobacteria bacterium]|nr:hypothetical protein [Actinomycetota bacterium]